MNFRDCRNAQEVEARAPQPKIVTAEDRGAHRLCATLDLVVEHDRLVVEAWYRSHPEEMREELEL